MHCVWKHDIFHLNKLCKLLDYDRTNGVWNIVDDLHVNPVNFFDGDAKVYLDRLLMNLTTEQLGEDDN